MEAKKTTRKKKSLEEMADEILAADGENLIEDSYTKPDDDTKDSILDIDEVPDNLENLEMEPPLLDLDFIKKSVALHFFLLMRKLNLQSVLARAMSSPRKD